MKRGFKSWCEQIAINYRKELMIEKASPLCPRTLADHLKVNLISPDDIDGLDSNIRKILLDDEYTTWSAVTISMNNQNVVIYNSSHTKPRQSNDIMHELSHIIIGHKPQTNIYSAEAGIFLRNYDNTQEEEADWLASTLLLPKDVLMKIKFSGMNTYLASKTYAVSTKLLNMRLNKSGINYIYKRSRKR